MSSCAILGSGCSFFFPAALPRSHPFPLSRFFFHISRPFSAPRRLRWYEAVALWISAVMPNQQVAQIIAGMTITFSNLFAGINIPPSDLAKGWIWLFDINGLSKLLQFNSMVQFNCDVAPCPQVAYTTNSGQLDVQTPLQWASARLTTSTETQWNSLGWLVLITVVFYILGGLGYAKIVHQKR